ncbi:MAG: hypothetical protein DRO00_03120 [Thermoproteota archaeon]|nr:MAG: hypothetical protein DRO00_03120 [Candidatus Korarchaeota archaeon]
MLENVKGLRIRDFLLGLAITFILLGTGGFWDLAVVKQNWDRYPLPFETIVLPRSQAGDLFFTLIVLGMFILLLIGNESGGSFEHSQNPA